MASSWQPKDRRFESPGKRSSLTHSPWASKRLAAEIFRHIARHNRNFEAVGAFAVGQDMCDSEPDDPCPEDDDMSLRCVGRHVQIEREDRDEGNSTILLLTDHKKISRNHRIWWIALLRPSRSEPEQGARSETRIITVTLMI